MENMYGNNQNNDLQLELQNLYLSGGNNNSKSKNIFLVKEYN